MENERDITKKNAAENNPEEKEKMGEEKNQNSLLSAGQSKENSNKLLGMGKKRRPIKKILKAADLFAALLAVWFAVVQYMAADKYEAVVKVVEEGGKVGVNPLTERLDYGDLPKGNSSTRFVTIENSGDMNIYVKVVKMGDISELIKLSRNDFVLSPRQSEKLEFLLEMPISADKGEYKGQVMIFKLPKVF